MPVLKSYDNLVKRLQKQCNIYKRLDRENGDIGKQFYKKVHVGKGNPVKSVPEEAISEYLRGGIISSFAEYEAFLQDVLSEMVDQIHRGHTDHTDSVILSSLETRRLRSNNPGTDTADYCRTIILEKLTNPRWSTFQYTFKEIFCKVQPPYVRIPSLKLLSEGEKFSFCYPLTGDKYSKITGLEENDVTYIFDLWYGMRCVAAHGGMLKALDRVRLQVPNTNANPSAAIKDGYAFSKFLKDNLKHPVPDKDSLSHNEFRLISSIPEKSFIKSNLLSTSPPKVADTVDNYFRHLQLDDSAASTRELNKGYGLYHIGRLAYFACELEKEMYITYRMFVRINQFLLLLAFRIQTALRKWIHKYGMQLDIIMYVDHDLMTNLEDIICKRDDEQEEKIKELMNRANSCACFCNFFIFSCCLSIFIAIIMHSY